MKSEYANEHITDNLDQPVSACGWMQDLLEELDAPASGGFEFDLTKPLGSKENPCAATNSSAKERAYRYCLCDKCGLVARCTPRFDFYQREDNRQLHCRNCFQPLTAVI